MRAQRLEVDTKIEVGRHGGRGGSRRRVARVISAKSWCQQRLCMPRRGHNGGEGGGGAFRKRVPRALSKHGTDPSAQRQRGQDIDKAVLSLVHLIVGAEKYQVLR